jgi:hypothetical protein
VAPADGADYLSAFISVICGRKKKLPADSADWRRGFGFLFAHLASSLCVLCVKNSFFPQWSKGLGYFLLHSSAVYLSAFISVICGRKKKLPADSADWRGLSFRKYQITKEFLSHKSPHDERIICHYEAKD